MAFQLNADAKRLLEVASIPESLWITGESLLVLPSALASSYVSTVEAHNLRELSQQRSPDDSPAGGFSQEATDTHFAQAFDGSCARVQLAVLDPHSKAIEATNNFIRSLSGNSLLVVDAPCGAGAAFLSFLCCIAELRLREKLPRMPLDVTLVGAELSGPARSYAGSMLDRVRETLAAQAINVTETFRPWDVLCDLSNADLIDGIAELKNDHRKRLLVVANFSAFLHNSTNRKHAQPQLAALFRHLSGDGTYAAWIEPQTNKATKADSGLLPWLWGQVSKVWNHFARPSGSTDELGRIPVSEAKFRLPLTPDGFARVRLAVVPLDLIRSK